MTKLNLSLFVLVLGPVETEDFGCCACYDSRAKRMSRWAVYAITGSTRQGITL